MIKSIIMFLRREVFFYTALHKRIVPLKMIDVIAPLIHPTLDLEPLKLPILLEVFIDGHGIHVTILREVGVDTGNWRCNKHGEFAGGEIEEAVSMIEGKPGVGVLVQGCGGYEQALAEEVGDLVVP